MNYFRTYQRLGFRGLCEQMYMFRRIKEGTLVGTDQFGTKYWENRDLPYGQHRWCEPKNFEAPSLWDPTNIPPEWHGWMHSQNDIVPSDKPLPTGAPLNNEKTDVPDHLNTHQVPASMRLEWRPNQTLNRERGYGVRNMFQTQVGGNGYYVQPGSVMSPRHVEFQSETRRNASNMGSKPETLKVKKFRELREAMNREDEELLYAAQNRSSKPIEAQKVLQ